MAPAKAKCIADDTEPYEKRFSANIQVAEEQNEAAIDREAVAKPEHAVCLKNREADFTTAASQWRTKPDAPSHGSSATTDRRFTTA